MCVCVWVGGGGVEGVVFHIYLSKSTGGVYKHNVFFLPFGAESFQNVSEGAFGFLYQTSSSHWKSKFLLTVDSYWFSFGISLLSNLANDICYDFYFSLQVFSTSVGLTKTVYNPAALKAAQKTSEEALKKKQVRKGGGKKRGKQQGFSY